ncbi:MAG: hypothetical protein J6U00_00935 [Ruminococcus sp.]|uniref:hypothetical protein n=1 Tax=Ruminococcus sp. TaxID=41978 RepID=UPI001B25B780|nr:hypothetical protein [Ruminococcus sp.]MBO7472564.1 hypothetical protein [Ruminococcus sp.]
MKRIFAFAAAAAAAVCLTACAVTGGGSSSRRNGLGCAFSSAVSITIDRLEAGGEVKRFGDGVWEIEFSEPNTLSGVKLEFSEGNVIASYKGLSFSVPRSAIPVKAMMLNLMKAVDDNATAAELTGEENDGLLSIKGSLDGGDYVLTVDENGILSTFEMPNNKLKMRFTELKTAEIALEQDTQASTEELSAGTAETLAIQ